MAQTPHTRHNPYPGPRSFQKGEKLYGRQRETYELLDLLIAERIVLLYSPSGAGKTSLIQAALLPELEAEGFRVLPPMRPSLEPSGENVKSANPYVLSLLLSLEEALPEDQQTPVSELAGMSLSTYLNKHAVEGDDWHGDVLIFDQFEEILTVDPTNTDRQVRLLRTGGRSAKRSGTLGVVLDARGIRGGTGPLPASYSHPFCHHLPAGAAGT